MEERVSWEVRLVGLLGVLWWFVHPWIALSYVQVPKSILGNFVVRAWALIGWVAGGYGLLMATEALHRAGLSPEERLMEKVREAMREYSKETGENVEITVSYVRGQQHERKSQGYEMSLDTQLSFPLTNF